MAKRLTRHIARESAVRLVYACSVNRDEDPEKFLELAVSEHELPGKFIYKGAFFRCLQ